MDSTNKKPVTKQISIPNEIWDEMADSDRVILVKENPKEEEKHYGLLFYAES